MRLHRAAPRRALLPAPDLQRAPHAAAGARGGGPAVRRDRPVQPGRQHALRHDPPHGHRRRRASWRRCERHGLEENTIVLFTSDNGPQFGGAGRGLHDRFNCQFNGAKGSVYEGGIRVPMLVRWPAGPRRAAASARDGPLLRLVPHAAGRGRACTRRRASARSTASTCCRSCAARRAQVVHAPLLAVEPLHAAGHLQRRHARRRLEAGPAGDPRGDAGARAIPGCGSRCTSPSTSSRTAVLRARPAASRCRRRPPPELYNIAEDPLEQENLADRRPDLRTTAVRPGDLVRGGGAGAATIDDRVVVRYAPAGRRSTVAPFCLPRLPCVCRRASVGGENGDPGAFRAALWQKRLQPPCRRAARRRSLSAARDHRAAAGLFRRARAISTMNSTTATAAMPIHNTRGCLGAIVAVPGAVPRACRGCRHGPMPGQRPASTRRIRQLPRAR